MLERKIPLAGLVLVDASIEMLSHSVEYVRRGAGAIIGDASLLPFADNTVSTFICSLGDPFNCPPLWTNIAKCLKLGGVCVFTSPSYKWATSFRSLSKDERDDHAFFELADGATLYVPSFVYSEEDQIAQIEAAGLNVVDTCEIGADKVSGPISPKLAGQRTIVIGYTAIRTK